MKYSFLGFSVLAVVIIMSETTEAQKQSISVTPPPEQQTKILSSFGTHCSPPPSFLPFSRPKISSLKGQPSSPPPSGRSATPYPNSNYRMLASDSPIDSISAKDDEKTVYSDNSQTQGKLLLTHLDTCIDMLSGLSKLSEEDLLNLSEKLNIVLTAVNEELKRKSESKTQSAKSAFDIGQFS